MHFELPEVLCSAYGKSTGIFTASGMLALWSALEILSLPETASVLFPVVCCWKVPEAIRRSGAHPYPAPVDSNLCLDLEWLEIEQPQVAAVVAVHPFGLPLDMAKLRGLLPNTPIIEDAAQAWRLLTRGNSIGQFSDLVVTSFGPTKPVRLGLGYGGAVLFDEFLHQTRFTMEVWHQTQVHRPPIPFGIPAPHSQVWSEVIHVADNRLDDRSQRASRLLTLWEPQGPKLHEGDLPSWNRIPLSFTCTSQASKAQKILASRGIEFQELVPDWSARIPYLSSSTLGHSLDKTVLLIRPDEDFV